MHILATRVVRKALASGARIDPVEHFDLLAELDRLARATAEPPAHDRIAFLDRPVIVGGYALRRLSFRARAWLADADEWFQDDRDLFGSCLAWACAHCRNRAAFDAVADPRLARQTVTEWINTLTCSPEQMEVAVRAIVRPLEAPVVHLATPAAPEVPDAPSTALGPVFARLLTECGGTLDYWMWEVSDDALNAILDAFARSDEADAKAAKLPPADWMPGVRAFKAWNAAAKAFARKVGGNVE